MRRNPIPCRRVFALALLATALFVVGCAGGGGAADELVEIYVVTRLLAPPEVNFQEVRLVDVDTDENIFIGGAFNGEPIVVRAHAGRVRFKSVRAEIPGEEKPPRFEQPEKAIELLPGAINYIGDIIIGRRRDGYPLFIDPRPQTVIDAARISPETFRGKTVVQVLGDRRPVRLRFEAEDGEVLPGLTD